MQLVKRIQLRRTELLDNLCIQSKNLYNVALYETRNYFFSEGKPLFYHDLWNLLKEHKNHIIAYELVKTPAIAEVLQMTLQN